MKQWQSVTLGVLVGLIASALILLVSTPPRGEPITLVSQPTPGNITIFVTGAIQNPGIYTLSYGSRAVDAVQAVGGMRSDADQSAIYLAARLKDGDKLLVPYIPTEYPNKMEDFPTPAMLTLSPEKPLNINTAMVEDLDLLPGIGSSKAAAIITYREKHGDLSALRIFKT